MRKKNLALTGAIVAISSGVALYANTRVDYPAGYRTWQHVKTMLIQPGHALEEPFGGIHHIYANPKALAGLRDGEYEDGAVFVFDLLGYKEGDLVIVETERKRVDVMQYNAEVFKETGGWGFETFDGDSTTKRMVSDGGAYCYGCHVSEKSSNFVFSKYRR